MTLAKLLPAAGGGGGGCGVNYKSALIYVGIPTTLAVAGYCFYRYSAKKSGEEQVNGSAEGSTSTSNDISSPSSTTVATAKTLKESGNKLFKIGKYDAALELYSKAIEACDVKEDREALEQLYQNRAAVFEKLGDFNSVIKETTAALKLNPKYVKALHRRSKAYKATGFLDESLEDITAVCILEQFSSPSSVQLADDVLKEIGAEEGQKLLKTREVEGRGLKPSRHTCTSYLRGFYNCPVSLVVVGRDDGKDEELEDCPYKKAVTLLRAHDYDDIIAACTAQLENHTTHRVESHYLRGTFRFLYGHSELQTLQDFEEVVKTSADRAYKASAYIKMASHYALVDKEEKCEDCFEESAKTWPDNVDLWHNRGQVLLTRGNLPAALELMTKAAELAPNYSIAVATKWYVQYRILGGSGDMGGADQCVREFEKMVKRFDTSPDVFSLYGQILMENQRFAEAELQFARVSELDKTNAGVLVHRAMAKFQQSNDVKGAITMLEDALKIDDRNEFVYETLGTLHLQNGELDPAILYIGKAVELARSLTELTILSSLKKAALVQKKVRDEMGLCVAPGFFK